MSAPLRPGLRMVVLPHRDHAFVTSGVLTSLSVTVSLVGRRGGSSSVHLRGSMTHTLGDRITLFRTA